MLSVKKVALPVTAFAVTSPEFSRPISVLILPAIRSGDQKSVIFSSTYEWKEEHIRNDPDVLERARKCLVERELEQ